MGSTYSNQNIKQVMYFKKNGRGYLYKQYSLQLSPIKDIKSHYYPISNHSSNYVRSNYTLKVKVYQ